MKSFIKNSAFELSIIAGIMLVCGICFYFGGGTYKQKYELEHKKFEQAQRAFDSLQIEKVELLKSAARHINSADSAYAVFTASKKDKQNQIKIYENNSNIIDNYTEQQLDSFFSVN